MWNVIVNGKVVTSILAWDRNDAWVYATRTYGMGATVIRDMEQAYADGFNAGMDAAAPDFDPHIDYPERFADGKPI